MAQTAVRLNQALFPAFAALTFAHLAFCAAAMAALPAADIPPFFGPRFGFSLRAGTNDGVTTLRGRPRFLGATEATTGATAPEFPVICASSALNTSILSVRSAALRSWVEVKCKMLMFLNYGEIKEFGNSRVMNGWFPAFLRVVLRDDGN